MERGFKKPAAVIEVGPSDPYEDLSDEELAALEAEVVAEIESDPVAGLLCDGNQEAIENTGRVAQESMSDAARAPSPEADPPETRNTVLLPGVLLRRKTST